MEPKKKSKLDYILYVVFLAVALVIAAHAAVAAQEAASMVAAGTLEESDQVMTAVNLFTSRIAEQPLSLYITEYTKKFLFYGFFIWMIAVLAIENKKRNYIRGKEYGTAKWGTPANIRDLFAENICREEIKRAKQVRTWLGRMKAKQKVYKACEKDGKALEQSKLSMLSEREADEKKNGTYNRTSHKQEVARIHRETKEAIAAAKREAWEPDRMEDSYKTALEEISDSPTLTDREKEARRKKAEEEYKRKRKEFYHNAARIEKIKAKYKDADMLLTKTERISIYNWKLNNNTLILGGSGSGKTRSYVIPNILQAHSSYIITDPKGEILEKVGYFLSEIKGYKIRVLNLDDKSQSDYYNPFLYIHPERKGYEERVLSLIETIIINTDGGEKKGGSDPFWDKAEKLFLQAVFFFTCDGFIPEERNMNTVMELIKMLKIEEDEDNYNSDLDYFAAMFKARFGADHIGVQQYEEFRQKASGKTAKSIVISAVARLAPFKTSEVRRIFSYDNMCLDRVGEEKTAIFVVVPPTDSTFNFIAGMLFTQLFQELQYCATQVHKHDGQRLPVPCRFILDEFATTCTIPNFVKILAYARSLGIGVTPILQSLEQIKNMYKDEWGVIVDNCNSLLFLGSITHMDTLEYMSKLLGKGTFDKKTTGHSRGRSGSSSENFDVFGRELLNASEIRKLDKKNCLLVVGGKDPFYSEKYPYESHPNYRYTSDGNHAYSYTYHPQPAPETAPKPTKEKRQVIPDEVEAGMVQVIQDPAKVLDIALRELPNMDVIADSLIEGTVSEEDGMQILEAFSRIDEGNPEYFEASTETRRYLDEQAVQVVTDSEEILNAMINENSVEDFTVLSDEDLDGGALTDEEESILLEDDENLDVIEEEEGLSELKEELLADDSAV
ncbi:MAG: type IV secretory system conjugative DNA transfer family protein [Clostridiales bacterium]|nr:type IV secretory system conjugative DNA transfer family protein [Clostridiales bacterium]